MRTAARTAIAVIGMAASAVLLPACTASPTEPADTAGLPVGDDSVALNPEEFTTDIDNPYWPMAPGTRWTYRETGPGGEFTVTVIVTSATRDIANGITARVVRDTVSQEGEIVEDTFDWYAQDAEGSIWYLGEDTAEFEGGEIASREGSFEAGVDGALPGIAVPAHPEAGLQYRQEYYAGEAEDNGEVLATHAMAETPFGQFDDALLTWDTSSLEPDAAELKFYAPSVGPVLTVEVSGGPGAREELLAIDTVPDGTGTQPLGQAG